MTASRSGNPDRSKRGQLQRMLGDLGEVFPRVEHGTPARPAQGWYCRLTADQTVVFLGDHFFLAGMKIGELHKRHEQAPAAKPRRARKQHA